MLCPEPMMEEPLYYETTSTQFSVGTLITYRCRTGYRVIGRNTVALCKNDGQWTVNKPSCRDINECSNNPCHSHAECKNTDGSYTCTCSDGYYGDGTSCTGKINQKCCLFIPLYLYLNFFKYRYIIYFVT